MIYHPIQRLFDPIIRIASHFREQTQRVAAGLDTIHGKRVSIVSDFPGLVTVELMIRLRDNLDCSLVDVDQAEIRIRITQDSIEAHWGNRWQKSVKSPQVPNHKFSVDAFLYRLAQALATAAN